MVCSTLQVRTQTLVKSAIIQIDATPFRQWYLQHYGVEVGIKKKQAAGANVQEDKVCLACSRLCHKLCHRLCHTLSDDDFARDQCKLWHV